MWLLKAVGVHDQHGKLIAPLRGRNKLNRQTSHSRSRGGNRILLEGIRGVIFLSSRNDYAHWRAHWKLEIGP
jgi:hypothetical protein